MCVSSKNNLDYLRCSLDSCNAKMMTLKFVVFSCIVSVVQNTEITFCSGQSKIVSMAPNQGLLIDGSNSALQATRMTSIESDTTCACSVYPTSNMGTATVSLKTNLDIKGCPKNLRIAAPPYYDHKISACTEHQAYTLETMGTKDITIFLDFVNDTSKMEDRYMVHLGFTLDSEQELKVSCHSPSRLTSSISSSTSSSSSSSSTSVSPPAGGSSTTHGHPLNETVTGKSKTVFVVCLIVGVGLLVICLTICLLCCLARRLERRAEKRMQRSPRRIYRRICHTIRNLPDTFKLRRPLPDPPATTPCQAFKNRSQVFATSSGPYDSIKSSVRTKTAKTVPARLKGGQKPATERSQYEYLYSVNGAPCKVTALTSSNGSNKYITPVQDSEVLNKTCANDSKLSDPEYVNTGKINNTGKVDGEMINTDFSVDTDDTRDPSTDYMDMGFTANQDKDTIVHISDSETDVEYVNDIAYSSQSDAENNSLDSVVTRGSANNFDNNLDANESDVVKPKTDLIVSQNDDTPSQEDRKKTPQKVDNTASKAPKDFDYVSMSSVDLCRENDTRSSKKDKTFPNLLKFHMASIKPRLYLSKKQAPPVKPKPTRYVRNQSQEE